MTQTIARSELLSTEVAGERALAESVSFALATREALGHGPASAMLLGYELSPLTLSLGQGLMINPEGVPGEGQAAEGWVSGTHLHVSIARACFESRRHMGVWHYLFCVSTHTRHQKRIHTCGLL